MEVGKRADFAVLDADLFEVATDSIRQIAVTQTWVDGTCRFDADKD
ncbi:MAG: amidohydrolase family protein [Terrimesophilobacter sp.]